MRSRIKGAFAAVRAEEALKESTLDFLEQYRSGKRPRRGWWAGQRLALAAACALLLALGIGSWLYFTPTASISIEVNPWIELGVNRFDRVVSVEGRNDDGAALADTLDLRFMDCAQAVRTVLESGDVSALLAEDEVVAIGVIGSDGAQCSRLLGQVETTAAASPNAYCYCADGQEAAAAEEAGLSCGKYRAYLALRELDPSVTPEAVRAMSMRELRQWIEALSAGNSTDSSGGESGAAGDTASGTGGTVTGNGAAAGETAGGSGQGWGGHHQEDHGHNGQGHGYGRTEGGAA